MAFIGNKTPQAERASHSRLHQLLYVRLYIAGRIYRISIDADMILSFSLIKSALAGVSGALLGFIEISHSQLLHHRFRAVCGVVVDC